MVLKLLFGLPVTGLTPDKKHIRAWGRFRNSEKSLEITAVSYLVPHLY